MKIISLLFLAAVGSTATAFDLGERDLQTCSSPAASIPCTTEDDPVKCGLNACPYANLCTAGAAGYSPSRCYPATCKSPAPDTVCTLESTPVVCGDSKCSYSNYCEAGAAGFPPTSCLLESCPTPDTSGGACSLEYDPFVCLDGGLCRYDNGCLATQAGFNPNPDVGQCVRVTNVPANLPTCPVVPLDAACAYDFDPVHCGGDRCFYTNTCESRAAGYTDAEDCENANCPAPAAGTVCTADFAPVTCGNFDCGYSNLCGAMAAGFSETECSLDSCPTGGDAASCSREYKPTQCGDDGCVYDNDCLAQAAGFEPNPTSGVCKPLLDGVNPAECPAQQEGGICTAELNEKQCGPLGCLYSNQCEADAAGYSEGECWQAYCPAPSTVDACDSVPDLITCGPYDCLYGNRCLANRAGFTPAECKPISCPVGDAAATACTLEYDPIICNSRLVSSGITCAYSNECLAAAAGYSTEDFAGQCVFASVITPVRSVPFETVSATDAGGTESSGATTTSTTEAPTTADSSAAAPQTMVVGSFLAIMSALVVAISALVMM